MKPNAYEITAWVLIAMSAAFLALMLWVTGACSHQVTPDDPAPSCDGSVHECCERACAALARYKCPGYQGSPGADDVYGTPDDVTCEAACEYAAVQTDIGIDLNLGCVAAAQSCTEVEACPSE